MLDFATCSNPPVDRDAAARLASARPAPYPPCSHGRGARSLHRGEPPALAPARVGRARRRSAAAAPARLPGARTRLGPARAAPRRGRAPRLRLGRPRPRRLRVDRARRLLPLRRLRRRRRLRGAPSGRPGRPARPLDGRQRRPALHGHRARARRRPRRDRRPRTAGLAARRSTAPPRRLDRRPRARRDRRASRPDARRRCRQAAALLSAHRGDLAPPRPPRQPSERRRRPGHVEVGSAARDALAAAVLRRPGADLLGPGRLPGALSGGLAQLPQRGEVRHRRALDALGAERVAIDGAAHHPHLEQPESTARVLLEFLARTVR